MKDCLIKKDDVNNFFNSLPAVSGCSSSSLAHESEECFFLTKFRGIQNMFKISKKIQLNENIYTIVLLLA
jgi:hypothetical protein